MVLIVQTETDLSDYLGRRQSHRTLVYSDPSTKDRIVGIPEVVNTPILFSLLKAESYPGHLADYDPSIPEGNTYNVNADTFAGAIAFRRSSRLSQITPLDRCPWKIDQSGKTSLIYSVTLILLDIRPLLTVCGLRSL